MRDTASSARSTNASARAEIVLRARGVDAEAIAPPRASPADMFARIRSASTCSAFERARTAAAAPPVAASAVGQRVPLGVPGAGGALVLVRQALEQDRGVAPARGARTRSRASPAIGLRLCGIVDEPPASRLAHLARPRSGRAARRRSRSSPRLPAAAASAAAELGDRYADRVPRKRRLAQVELGGVQACHLDARARRTRRASPLRRRAAPAALHATTASRARVSTSPTSQPAAL